MASGNCYLLTLTGTDNVGNTTSISTTVKVDTTAPSAPTGFTFSGLTNAYYPGAGTTVYVKGGAAGGFTALASGSTDADTGVAGYSYGAIAGTGWANTAGAYTFTAASPTGTGAVTATSNAGLTGASASFTAQVDSTAPSGGAFSANSTAATGVGTTSYLNAGTTLTINSRTDYTDGGSGLASSTLTMQTGTLSGNSCSAYGAPATIVGTTSQTVASGHCYLLTLTGTDNVGNTTSISTTVMVDTTAPSAPSLAYSAPTNAFYPGSGSIVYFKGGTAGGFTVTASGSTDADTGIAGYTYPALGAGWSNAAGVYSFTGGAGTQSGSVTAQNNAGLSSAGTSFTAQSDTTAPTGGAFTANGIAASGAGTTSYLNSGTTLAINSRTDFTETQTATASGLASSTLTIQTATFSGGGCGSFGVPTTITGTTSQTVASGNCYLLTLRGTDNVGNQSSSVSTTVMVDTTGPTAPTTFTFGSLSGSAYWPGSGSVVYFQGGTAGGFTATASGSTDPQSGVASYNYGAIAGTGWGNTAGAYTFTAASPTGSGTVTATNNAGVTGAGASFTAQSDTTAPVGGAFSANGTAATGGGSASYLNSGTTLTINSRTDYTEAQTGSASGLANSTLTIKSATFSGNSCGSYGAPATITGTTSQTVASGNCYLLTLTGTDNVGNATSISTVVKVDTTAPSAASSLAFSAPTHAYYPGAGSTVYFQGGGSGGFTVTASGSSDADSGVAGYTYPTFGSGWSNTAGAYTFNSSAATQTGSVTAQNNAGLSSSGTSFTAQSDSTAPTSSLTCNGFSCPGGWSNSTPVNIDINASDGGSGVASITYTTDGSDPTSSGTATTVNAATASFQVSSLTTIKWFSTDNVGNASSVQSTTLQIDTTPPTAPTGFAFSATNHAFWPGSGSTVYFQGGGSGGFTVAASGSTDSQSGVGGYNYPALGADWSNTNGAYTFTGSAATQSGSVTATDVAGNTGSGTSFTAQSDSSAPTSSVTCNSIACSAGWYTVAPVSVSVTGSDSAAGVKRIVYTTDGSAPTINGSDVVTNGTAVAGATASLNVSSDGTTTVRWIAEDNVGNVSGISNQVVELDTTPPSAPTGFSFSSPTHAYYPGAGSTIFFQGGVAGGFTVTASGSTDGESGVAGYTYPALGTGWSHTNGAYSFTGSAGTQSGSVTAQNNAGLSSAATSFTAQVDSAAPTSSVTCNTAACSAGWYTTSPVSIAITGSDAAAGVERIVYTTDGSAPTINGSDTVTNGTEVAGSSATFNISTLGTTTVKWIAEDNVGNISSVSSQTVKLDTTAPTAPSLSYSSFGHAYYPGSGSTVFFQSGGTGGFTVTGSGSADGESGVAGYTYPALGTGWSNTGGAYTFTGSAGTQSGSVTAQNNAGLSSTGTSFTAQADGSAPTSSVTCNTIACSAGWYTSSPVAIAISGSDAAAGVERIVYTTDGSAPTVNGSDTVTNGTAVAGASASFNITALGTTTVKWIAEDNVGNISTVSSQIVKLDTTAPNAPTGLSFSSPSHAYWPGAGTTVFFQGGVAGGFTVSASGSSDAESGLAGYTYPSLGSGWSNTGGAYSFTNSAGTQTGSMTAQNNAGLTSAGTSFTAQSDSAAPTSSVTCNTIACSAGWYTTSPVAVAISGSDSGGAGVERIVYTTDGSAPTINGSDVVTNGTEVDATSASFNITSLGTNTVKWIAEDNVGNISGVSTQTVKLDTTAPTAPTGFTFSSTSHAYWPGAGATVYFQGGGTGGFTVAAAGSTDADSGIAGYTYPALGSGWSGSNGNYTFNSSAATQTGSVTAQNNAGLSSSGTSFTAQSDSAAPTSSVTCNTIACSAAWYTTSPVAIAITGSDAAAGVERIVYTTDGSAPTINGSDVVTNGTEVAGNSATFNISTLGTTTVKWIAEDNVGNISSVSSQTVKLDTTAPTAPTGFSFSSPTHAYYPGSGSTIYFQNGGTGGFTVAASGSTDGESGVAGYTYPALGSGWSGSNGNYTFNSSAATQTGSVTAQNNAGLSSSGTSFTAQSDSAAPTSSLSCNGSACPGGWTNSIPVTIGISASDGGSGVASITYTTDGSDPTTSGTATTVNAASTSFPISSAATIKWFSTDNVGNASSVQSTTLQIDTTPPTAPTGFAFSSPTHAFWPGSGSTVYFQGGGSGGFTVAASGSTDSQSGVGGYNYPALGSGWLNTGGVYSYNSSAATQSGSVTATDNAGNTGSGTSFTAQSDSSAPTSSVTCNSIACSAGWYTVAPVSVSITGNDAGAGVERIVYTTDSSAPTINGSDAVTNGTEVDASSASLNVSSDGTTTVRWIAEDNVGNISGVSSQTVKLDTTPPTAPTGFTFSSPSHAYWPGSGSTVYFQGGGSGGFTVAASGSTDATSGVAGYTYPALGTGWAHANGAYTFNSSAATQSGPVTAQDNASNSSSGASFTAQFDAAAPTSSVTCNTAACSAGWYTTSPVSIAITGSDAAAGVERIVYTTDGSAPTINGSDTVTNGTEVAGPSATFNISTLGTTTVKWIAEDNVGNISSVSTQTVKLDTTAPSAPTGFTFTSPSHAYWPGSGTTVYFQNGGTGGFTVAASGSADGESGVAGYTYPALGTGWSNTGGAYTFTGSAGTQSGSVTAQNNAGLSSTGTSFTAQADGSAPTSSVTCNTIACSAGWYTTSPVAVAISGSDGGAGVERIVYTTDGSAPTINGSDTVTNGTAVAGNTASFNISTLGTTTVKWIAEDNVGNISTVSSQIVKLDTTAPNAPSLSYSGFGNAYYPGAGSTVFFQGGGSGGFTVSASGSSDAQSGLAGYTYPSLGSGWTNTGGGYTFDGSAGTQTGSVTAQNNAGLTSAGTSFTAQSDSAAPTSSVTCNTIACSAGWYTTSPVAVAISGSDGAAGVERIVYTTDGSAPTINGSDVVTNGTEVDATIGELQHHQPRHQHGQVDRRGQRRQHLRRLHPDGQARHHRADRADRLLLLRHDRGLLPGQRLDRLLPERRHRRLHRRRQRLRRRATPASRATPTRHSAAAGRTPTAPTPSAAPPEPRAAPSPRRTTPGSRAPARASPRRPTAPPRPARSAATAPPARPAGTPPARSPRRSPPTTEPPASSASSTPPTAARPRSTAATPSPTAPRSPAHPPASTSPRLAPRRSSGSPRTTSATSAAYPPRRSSSTPPPRPRRRSASPA